MSRLTRRSSGLYVADPGPFSPVPVGGNDLVTDGGMENWASATDLTSWGETLAGTSTVNREGTVKFAGNYSCRFDVDATNGDVEIQQRLTAPAGSWIQVVSQWRTSVAGKTGQINLDGVQAANVSPVTGSFTQFTTIHRAALLNPWLRMVRATASGASLYVEVESAKILTASSLFRGGMPISFRDGAFQGDVTLIGGNATSQAGIALLNDSLTLGLIAYHDGTSAYLYKIGTEPVAISGAAAYGAGRTIKVVRSGDTFQLFYNGSKIGSDTAITGLPTLTQFKAFGTYSTNSITNLRAEAA